MCEKNGKPLVVTRRHPTNLKLNMKNTRFVSTAAAATIGAILYIVRRRNANGKVKCRTNEKRYAAVELGGTSVRVAIAEGRADNIVERDQFPTTTPSKDIPRLIKWLKAREPFVSLGIASFGPIDPRKGSATFGYITSTPKKAWRNTDLVGPFKKAFNCPIGFDTDVNAPALYEYEHARSRGADITSCAYVTVGTGVGVGLVVNGKNVHGMLHPEAGHVLCPQKANDSFKGLQDWTIPMGVEAHTCSLALAKQANVTIDQLKDLKDDNPLWDNAAYYLAVLCVNLILIVSPERIVLGGGVFNRTCLYGKVRSQVQKLLNGYIQVDSVTTSKIDSFIVSPIHKGDAGLVGALSLSILSN